MPVISIGQAGVRTQREAGEQAGEQIMECPCSVLIAGLFQPRIVDMTFNRHPAA